MFPRLRQRLGTAVLDRLDLLVELTTLGEYGIAEDGLPLALTPPAPGDRSRPRRGDACPERAGRGEQSPLRLRDECGGSRPAGATGRGRRALP